MGTSASLPPFPSNPDAVSASVFSVRSDIRKSNSDGLECFTRGLRTHLREADLARAIVFAKLLRS
jgi:hypothetical protein